MRAAPIGYVLTPNGCVLSGLVAAASAIPSFGPPERTRPSVRLTAIGRLADRGTGRAEAWSCSPWSAKCVGGASGQVGSMPRPVRRNAARRRAGGTVQRRGRTLDEIVAMAAAYKVGKRPPYLKRCPGCGDDFYASRSNQRACSDRCSKWLRRHPLMRCGVCEKRTFRLFARQIYCGPGCRVTACRRRARDPHYDPVPVPLERIGPDALRGHRIVSKGSRPVGSAPARGRIVAVIEAG